MTTINIDDLKKNGLRSWIVCLPSKIIEFPFDFDQPSETCWNLTSLTGNAVRSVGLDGLASWNPFKKILEERPETFELSSSIIELVSKHYNANQEDLQHSNSVLAIGEIVLTHNDKNDSNKEQHHFLIQHFRLVAMCANNTITITKLMQLAYNAGQFKAQRHIYDKSILEFYDANKLGDFGTYVK